MIRKKIYGEQHPEVAVTYYNLVVDFRKLGQHTEAKECDEKAQSLDSTLKQKNATKRH